ncbi:MAG: glycosyltransferase family 1 protein [Candidatus Saccharimonadales bacterium]
MKTICFDLRALQIGHQNRGIGMYIISVLEHLPKNEDKYLFYCFDKNNPVKDLGVKMSASYEIVQTKTRNTILGSPKDLLTIYKLVHHAFKPLRAYKPDTFVQFDFTLGVPHWNGVHTIVIGYDLIPLIMNNDYIPSASFAWKHSTNKLRSVIRAWYYKAKYYLYYNVYKRADMIACISEATAKSFQELLHISRNRLTVIPLAPVTTESLPNYDLANKFSKPYIFYIGGTDARKHIEDIIRAYNIVRGRGHDISLLLAGYELKSLGEMTDVIGKSAIQKSPYRQDIHFLGFITDAEKMGLYNKALAFVFTSFYEGFGLPVVEAMAASCPVITYNNSSIPEAAGSAALLVETGNYSAIATQITLLLSDPKLRSQLIGRGRNQATIFSWDSYITTLLGLL